MFGPEVDQAILKYAEKEAPSEACGYIIDGKFSRRRNRHEEPEKHFTMTRVPKRAQAVVHSHPGGPAYPSNTDMRQQVATDLPWGIAVTHELGQEVFWWGDDVPIPPLIGRGFRHGVTDCYSLCRDFYRLQHNLTIPEFPRGWEWWDEPEEGELPEDLYAKGFEQAGFFEIGMHDLLPGDAFLATVRSRYINHAGIYLGNGLILHHTCGREGFDPSRLSTVEPGARWLKFVSKVVRHENHQIDRSVGQGVWPLV